MKMLDVLYSRSALSASCFKSAELDHCPRAAYPRAIRIPSDCKSSLKFNHDLLTGAGRPFSVVRFICGHHDKC
jgi:hypothetical protein